MTSAYDVGAEPTIELRHRLRIAREFAGLDQEQLAELMEVTRSTISNAETGTVEPRRATVNAWALACGVRVSWIRGEHSGGNPDPSSGLGIISPTQSTPTQQSVVLIFPDRKSEQGSGDDQPQAIGA